MSTLLDGIKESARRFVIHGDESAIELTKMIMSSAAEDDTSPGDIVFALMNLDTEDGSKIIDAESVQMVSSPEQVRLLLLLEQALAENGEGDPVMIDDQPILAAVSPEVAQALYMWADTVSDQAGNGEVLGLAVGLVSAAEEYAPEGTGFDPDADGIEGEPSAEDLGIDPDSFAYEFEG